MAEKDPYDKNFEVRVKTHVYDVLNTRELTVREVTLLKNAFSESLELLLSRHTLECVKRQNEKFRNNLTIAVGIITITNLVVTWVIKLLGSP